MLFKLLMRILLFLTILAITNCGLVPISEVIDHTEVKLNLASAIGKEEASKKQEIEYYEKVLDIEEEGYIAIVNTFKNIVLLITS
jgi:hypothetical protein